MVFIRRDRVCILVCVLWVDPNWREFRHPLFKKGHIELLPLIKRKNSSAKVKSEKRDRCTGMTMIWVDSIQRSRPFTQCECKEESNRSRYLSSRADHAKKADIQHGIAVQQRSEGKPIFMEDFHEQQEAARRNEAADGTNLQVHQQADYKQSHSRQFRRFQSIRSLWFCSFDRRCFKTSLQAWTPQCLPCWLLERTEF